MMPLPQLWSICFFVMLILLGLDTQVRHRYCADELILDNCIWKFIFYVLSILCTVRRHGGGDDVDHRYVPQSNAQGRPAGEIPPRLLPNMFLLSACHDH